MANFKNKKTTLSLEWFFYESKIVPRSECVGRIERCVAKKVTWHLFWLIGDFECENASVEVVVFHDRQQAFDGDFFCG